MATSDTDDDIMISSALLIASTLLSTNDTVTQINIWHVYIQLTNHSLAREKETEKLMKNRDRFDLANKLHDSSKAGQLAMSDKQLCCEAKLLDFVACLTWALVTFASSCCSEIFLLLADLVSCTDNVQVLSAATGRVSASRHWNDDLQQSRIPSAPHTSQLSARGQPGGRRWTRTDQPSSRYDIHHHHSSLYLLVIKHMTRQNYKQTDEQD